MKIDESDNKFWKSSSTGLSQTFNIGMDCHVVILCLISRETNRWKVYRASVGNVNVFNNKMEYKQSCIEARLEGLEMLHKLMVDIENG